MLEVALVLKSSGIAASALPIPPLYYLQNGVPPPVLEVFLGPPVLSGDSPCSELSGNQPLSPSLLAQECNEPGGGFS